jgi:hypothetical protein
MEGYTPSELAKILRLKLKTVKLRLAGRGCKPITNEKLYDKISLEIIREDISVEKTKRKNRKTK